MLNKEIEKEILVAQQDEINEHFVYQKLSKSIRDGHNRGVLEHIAEDELNHYHFWKKHTQQDIKPQRWVEWKYYLISKLFGITFGIKLMEKGETIAQVNYEKISKYIPGAIDLRKDEMDHEKELINLINEEKMRYVGSMVLGLSDALVELTGALAGFTFTLRNTRLIAMAGLITGIAASLSMAGSEYLSTKSEESLRDPLKASLYTGMVYVFTVFLLIFPFLLFEDYFFSFGFTLFNAIVVILLFTFYISVAKEIPFKKRSVEMVLICFGVAIITFIIGYLVRLFLNVEI